MTELDLFINTLEKSLYDRYTSCPGVATPESILLAVTNAVADARLAVEKARKEKSDDRRN